jgi:hypothetical protein
VCRDEAEAITAEVARTSGIAAGRTSHRLRNPRNAPRPWARADVEAAAGKKAAEVTARPGSSTSATGSVCCVRSRRWRCARPAMALRTGWRPSCSRPCAPPTRTTAPPASPKATCAVRRAAHRGVPLRGDPLPGRRRARRRPVPLP